MIYNPDKHHRRSIRLKGYDYSQSGAYFITIVAQNRECLFGQAINGVINLNNAGNMIQEKWEELKNRFKHVNIDAFIVMPNHLHGIVIVNENVGASLVDAQNNANNIKPSKMIPNNILDDPNNNVHSDHNRAGTRPAPC